MKKKQTLVHIIDIVCILSLCLTVLAVPALSSNIGLTSIEINPEMPNTYGLIGKLTLAITLATTVSMTITWRMNIPQFSHMQTGPPSFVIPTTVFSVIYSRLATALGVTCSNILTALEGNIIYRSTTGLTWAHISRTITKTRKRARAIVRTAILPLRIMARNIAGLIHLGGINGNFSR